METIITDKNLLSFLEKEKSDASSLRNPETSGKVFEQIPPERRTLGVCLTAVLTAPENIYKLERGQISEDIIKIAVEKDHKHLAILDKHPDLSSKEIYLHAFKYHVEAFESFPEGMKTSEICNEAVNRDSCQIKHVPIELRNREMCEKLVDNTPAHLLYSEKLLAEIPHNLIVSYGFNKVKNKGGISAEKIHNTLNKNTLSQDLVNHILSIDGNLFEQLPSKFKSAQNALIAFKSSGIEAIPVKISEDRKIITFEGLLNTTNGEFENEYQRDISEFKSKLTSKGINLNENDIRCLFKGEPVNVRGVGEKSQLDGTLVYNKLKDTIEVRGKSISHYHPLKSYSVNRNIDLSHNQRMEEKPKTRKMPTRRPII